MENKLQVKLNSFRSTRKARKKWLSVLVSLCAIVALGTSYLLINPAVTQQQEIFCGMEEHKEHSEDCYEKVLVCGLTEGKHVHSDGCYEERKVLNCRLTEEDGHVHGDGCYSIEKILVCEDEDKVHKHTDECYKVDESRLICDLPIHEHTLQCFSNPDADVETATVWEKTFNRVELSGNWDEDVLAIAKTQLGYKESKSNYEVQEDGTSVKGYTRYGDWYGDSYGDWCAMYCSFCLDYAGVDEDLMPLEASCSKWVEKLTELDMFRENDGYTPKPGDLIFFDWKDDNGRADHVGFVSEVTEATEKEEAKINTIEGNRSGSVKCDSYEADDEGILGYGVLPENPDAVAAEPEEISAEDTSTREPDAAAEDRVGGYVYISGGEAGISASAARIGKADFVNDEEEPQTGGPLDVEDYIPNTTADGGPGAVLEYRINSETSAGDWVKVADAPETGVPGDADIRLSINFEGVVVKDLQDAGYQMKFDVPEIMRNPEVGGDLTDKAGKKIGTIKVENGKVLLTFNKDWVDRQQQYKEDGTPLESKIDGYFWVLSEINLTEATETEPPQIVIGEVEIDINFEEEIIEKNGDVNIGKSRPEKLEQAEDGSWYLTYTLTVTAGEDGCPKASVKDIFTYNDYTGEYIVVAPADANCTTEKVSVTKTDEEGEPVKDENGKPVTKNMQQLTWNIGDMKPNETKTLTYKVKVDDSFVGGAAKSPLVNDATVYSKEYKKTDAQAEFKPKAEVIIDKSRSHAVYDKLNGTYYEYQVKITAPDTNEYTLNPVIFKDSLEGTNKTVLPYVYYGGSNWTIKKDGESLGIPWDGITMAEDGKSFTLDVGTMAPGEEITLTYTVKIDPGAYPAMGNESSSVRNDAYAILDEDNVADAQDSSSYTLEHREWARKTAGERQDIGVTVEIPENAVVYDDTTKDGEQNISGPITSPGEIYTVPAGSYLYQVVVNETGDWDVSSASMQDKFSQAWMEYQGYVRVDVYNMGNNNLPTIGNSDATVIANLSKRDPVKTVWVKVDGESGFKFTPKDIGVEGPYAYMLTYYAAPKTNASILDPVVANEFELTGEVGPEGHRYVLNGVKESVSVEVETDTSMNAQKYAWYYAPPVALSNEELNNGYSNGAAYWFIKADGYLGNGTIFKDTSASGSSYRSYMRPDSLVGLYVGNIDGKDMRDYQNLAELLKDNRLEALGSEYYSVEYQDASGNPVTPTSTSTDYNAVITLDKKVDLEKGESLYIIYRTAGQKLTSASKTYKNMMQYSQDGTNYSDLQDVSLTDYAQEHMEKKVFLGTYDGETFTGQLSEKIVDTYPKVPSEVANSADIDNGGSIPHGTYVNWFIRLGTRSNMSGRYRVYDHIPDGLTPEFVYMYNWTTNYNATSVRQDVDDLHNELGGTWTEHITTMNGYESYYTTTPDAPFTVYWYSDENNNIVLDFDGFKRSADASTRGIQMIIGTRVTDKDVTMGNKEGVYNNTAELRDADNKKDDESSASQTVKIKTLDKKLMTENVKTAPFYIAVNPLGEDLASGENTITVKDILSENLTLDVDSVKAYRIDSFDWESFDVSKLKDGNGSFDNTKATLLEGQPVIKKGDEDNTYLFTVPDNMPILIVYDTTVNTLPGVTVSIKNTAHWEGVTAPEEVVVERKEYHYETGGGASGNTPPSIQVVKRDKNHMDRRLKGAKFELQEMVLTNGNLREKADAEPQVGETDENGTLEFLNLTPNTVYRLTEIDAPYAYELDSTPHYFIVAKLPDGSTDYPAIVAQALAMTDPKVSVQYWESNPQYTVDISDAPIEYALPESGGMGITTIYALSALLMAGAVICGSFSRRKHERRFK